MKRQFVHAFAVLGLLTVGPRTQPTLAANRHAKNVILFLGDAAGIPTVHGASIYGYGEPRKLVIQNMPYLALVETSSASEWVTDSAAGMTAIVTGRKTHNGVVAQSDSAVRRQKDGEPLTTILEYAEERGLSTGVISNSSIASATPAALYAHVNDRRMKGEIFAQILKPRFGNGVDVVIGPDRHGIIEATRLLGLDVASALKAGGYGFYSTLQDIPAGSRRVVVLLESSGFDLGDAARRAVEILSRNPRGYFLMVESDVHTENIILGLERTVAFDRLIRDVATQVSPSDTLILFTADHSYDFRIHDGDRGKPLFSDKEKGVPSSDVESVRLENIRRDDDHTGEEVLLTGQGPGADRIKGMISNTDIFRIMMKAYGWEAAKETRPAAQTAGGQP